ASVQTLRAFGRADDVAFEGTFYSSAGFTLRPTPAQRPGPPIWIGSWGSAAGLRRVAHLADGCLASGYNTSPDLFAQAWADVQAELAARGRDAARFPNGIATMWCYVTDDRARADALLTDALATGRARTRCSGTCWRRCWVVRWSRSVRFSPSALRRTARGSCWRMSGRGRNASSSARARTSAPSSSCSANVWCHCSMQRGRSPWPGFRGLCGRATPHSRGASLNQRSGGPAPPPSSG